MAQFIATPSGLGRFFTRISTVTIKQNSLVIHFKNNTSRAYLISDFTNFTHFKKGLFSGKITLNHGTKTVISFLNKKQAQTLSEQLNSVFSNYLEEKVNTAKTLVKRYATNEYLRDSNVPVLKSAVFSLVQQYGASPSLWQQYLSITDIKFLTILSSSPTAAHATEQLRKTYEQKTLAARADFYNVIESNPLTQEQRLGVIRNNDKNLVLAAAGTGKTSVIVAKALDLIVQEGVKPEHILILAYNKNAANELTERFNLRVQQANLNVTPPTILTFHALGLKLLKSDNKTLNLSPFAKDALALNKWFTQWLSNTLKTDSRFCKTFVETLYEPNDSLNTATKTAIKAQIYHTLSGLKVSSYQHLLIANWLYMYGIEHTYQNDDTADFYLPQHNIYLVHFAIDRQGNSAQNITKSHNSGHVKSVRAHHKKHGQMLVQTFHYNWQESQLEQRLKTQLQKHNVNIKPLDNHAVYERLSATGLLKQNINKYLNCLSAIRGEHLSSSQIAARIAKSGIINHKRYTTLLVAMQRAYAEKLKEQGAIDFDDMITSAEQAVKSGKVSVPWRHILVDEFQDISCARMALLNTLIKSGPQPCLTAVGDDWQAIYRFSGGNLALTTRFNDLIGSHSITLLQKTFRYNNSISEVAGRFVMQNPEQYKKHITTHTQVSTPQVVLLDDLHQGKKSVALKVQQIIATINKNNSTASIAVLSRYRFMLNEVEQHLAGNNFANPLHFWTLHGAKGLEADYCIIIGFEQGKLGFPSNNPGNLLVEALLPTQDTFKHSEERRLLYVGITRAKHKSYLIAPPSGYSEFISELINDNYPIDIASNLFAKQTNSRISKDNG
ncbi:UvrD-helicase domain-containing protein [Pseudoalteromonas sp. P1-7a]|uniref:UvrD-helicase domain-containing protein n=1 Tax=Pseudoalteromonas sp. P1-7a TaxID=1723755 RepID=UPI0006D66CC0|nr:UvrD-helicase domain-containing protein [Pseudoalteromonas sp. P1-7a]KPZ55670.1 Helicase IV [Pseudoalteromonas sp. P1-7a]